MERGAEAMEGIPIVIYIKVTHLLPKDAPDEFIGPFPDTTIAVYHRLIYGPSGPWSRVVRVDGEPPGSVMTPGEAVDYALARA